MASCSGADPGFFLGGVAHFFFFFFGGGGERGAEYQLC